ncbi:MAG: DUF2141 domain-containing protein [Spirosomataceae bacterium]
MIYASTLLCTLLFSIFQPTNPPSQVTNECTIRITGFETTNGKAFVKILDINNKPLKTYILPITDKQIICKIDVTGQSKVAVQVFHDINNNKKLDKNLFGAPAEPWGISGETRPSFRAPTLAEMLVSVHKDVQVIVK